MDQQTVVALMMSCMSVKEWNDNCKLVKNAHGGQYPSYWWEVIIQSGLAEKVMARFGETPTIRVK